MFKLAVAGLFLVLALIASGVEAQELKRITMGYPSLAFTQSHIWVGKEQGLFRKYGVEVDPVFLRGGQVATQALAAGEPPMVNVGTVIQANLTGYNLVLGRQHGEQVLSAGLRPARHNQPGTTQR